MYRYWETDNNLFVPQRRIVMNYCCWPLFAFELLNKKINYKARGFRLFFFLSTSRFRNLDFTECFNKISLGLLCRLDVDFGFRHESVKTCASRHRFKFKFQQRSVSSPISVYGEKRVSRSDVTVRSKPL